MSDMKHYIGDYSYDGIRGVKKDGVRLITIKWFVYNDLYYKPAVPLVITLADQPEEGGWILAECPSAGITIGGEDIEEALGNAFMMASHQYVRLVDVPDDKIINVRELRDMFKNWEVHSVGSQAQ